MSVKWNDEKDVIVIGGGAAGLAAAVSVAQKGKSVSLIEKVTNTGGDSRASGQQVIGLWPKRTKETTGEDDDLDKYMTDFRNSHWASAKGRKGEELADKLPFSQRLYEKSPEMYEWMESLGLKWDGFPATTQGVLPQPLWDTIYPRTFSPHEGNIVDFLDQAAEKYGVEVYTSTEARKLIADDDGAIVGVCVLKEDNSFKNIRAKKGVILATGSFNSSRSMVAKYLPDTAAKADPAGSPMNDGDGHRMTQDVGGDLRDMSLGAHWLALDATTKGWVFQLSMLNYGGPEGKMQKGDMPGILVNFAGKRYMSESLGYKYIGLETSKQLFQEGYYVFDSSDDVAKNILPKPQKGFINFILKGDTLEELANKMFIEPKELVAQVKRYNGFIKAGKDEDFGKHIENCQPIERGPFYAIKLHPRHYATYGGISTNVESQVLDKNGGIIPHLYAAGMCTGSYAEQEGLYYAGGVCQALVFGRQAAANVLNG